MKKNLGFGADKRKENYVTSIVPLFFLPDLISKRNYAAHDFVGFAFKK